MRHHLVLHFSVEDWFRFRQDCMASALARNCPAQLDESAEYPVRQDRSRSPRIKNLAGLFVTEGAIAGSCGFEGFEKVAYLSNEQELAAGLAGPGKGTPMLKVLSGGPSSQAATEETERPALDELAREGARRMIAAALEVEEIPKTSVGKFDKKRLRAQATPLGGNSSAPQETRPQRTPI